MAEWMKARDSKSRIPKGIGGSNPSLSVPAFGWIDYGDMKIDYPDFSLWDVWHREIEDPAAAGQWWTANGIWKRRKNIFTFGEVDGGDNRLMTVMHSLWHIAHGIWKRRE
jgi:hypothetical protein